MSEETPNFMPPTMMGTVYWKDHVVAVIDDHAEAERAVADLVEAEFSGEDARAWRGEFVTQNHAYFLQHRSVLQCLGSALPSDEGEHGEQLGAAARQGHSILTVRAAMPERVAQARDVLRRHGAHSMKHYGPNTIADF